MSTAATAGWRSSAGGAKLLKSDTKSAGLSGVAVLSGTGTTATGAACADATWTGGGEAVEVPWLAAGDAGCGTGCAIDEVASRARSKLEVAGAEFAAATVVDGVAGSVTDGAADATPVAGDGVVEIEVTAVEGVGV